MAGVFQNILWKICNFLSSQFFVAPQKDFMNGKKTSIKHFSGAIKKSEKKKLDYK